MVSVENSTNGVKDDEKLIKVTMSGNIVTSTYGNNRFHGAKYVKDLTGYNSTIHNSHTIYDVNIFECRLASDGNHMANYIYRPDVEWIDVDAYLAGTFFVRANVYYAKSSS